MPRRKYRGRNYEHYLYLPEGEFYRVARRISHRQGERMVAEGRAEHIFTQSEGRNDYLLVLNAPAKNGVSARQFGAAITPHEMELIAGQAFRYGKSRTRGMTEMQRLSRVHPTTRKPLPAEDEVERAVEKLKSWPRRRAA